MMNIFLLLGILLVSHCSNFYVDGEKGNDKKNNGTLHSPFKTIQKAIDTSPSSDTTIFVQKGDYPIQKPISIYQNFNLTIRSFDDDALSFETVIHTSGDRSSFLVFIANSSLTTIKDLSFAGGNDPFVCGGIFVRDSSDTYIENCVVSNSWGLKGGGGYVWNSRNTIFKGCELRSNYALMENKAIESVLVKSDQFGYHQSLFMGNYPSYLQDDYYTGFGGGLYIQDSDVTFDNSILFNNSALFGGAMVIVGKSNVDFVGSRLIRNKAVLQGSALFVFDKSSLFVLNNTDVMENHCTDFRCQVIYSNVMKEGWFNLGSKLPSLVPFLLWMGSVSGIVLVVNGLLQCVYYTVTVILSRRKKKLLFSVKSAEFLDEDSSSSSSSDDDDDIDEEDEKEEDGEKKKEVIVISSRKEEGEFGIIVEEEEEEDVKDIFEEEVKRPTKVDYDEIKGETVSVEGINNSNRFPRRRSSRRDDDDEGDSSRSNDDDDENSSSTTTTSDGDGDDKKRDIKFIEKNESLWRYFCGGVCWYVFCKSCESDEERTTTRKRSKRKRKKIKNRKKIVSELLTMRIFEEENQLSYYCLQIIYLWFGFSNSLFLWRIVHVFLILVFFVSVLMFELIDESKTTRLEYDTFDSLRNYIKLSNRFVSYTTPLVMYISMLLFYTLMRKEWRLFNCYNLFFAITLLISGLLISILLSIIFYDDIEIVEVIIWLLYGQVLSIFIFSCSTISDYMILIMRQYFIKIRDTFHKPYFQGEKAIFDFIRLKAILKRVNESTWIIIIPLCCIVLVEWVNVVISSIIGVRIEATNNESVFQRYSFFLIYGIACLISLIFFSRVTMSSEIWMKRVEGFLLNSRYDNAGSWNDKELKLMRKDEEKFNSVMLFTNAKEMRRTLMNPDLPVVGKKAINELIKFNNYVRSTFFVFRFPFTIDLTFSNLARWITIVFGCITATSVFSRNFSQILFINQ